MDDIEVTAPELGDWLGLTDRSVRDLAADGTIPRSRRGRYPLKAGVRAYCAHAREVAAGRASQNGELDIVAERARLAKEQADKLEMENAAARGELLPRADVVSALQAVFARCRARRSRRMLPSPWYSKLRPQRVAVSMRPPAIDPLGL